MGTNLMDKRSSMGFQSFYDLVAVVHNGNYAHYTHNAKGNIPQTCRDAALPITYGEKDLCHPRPGESGGTFRAPGRKPNQEKETLP